MKVLVACEFSGVVRDAFWSRGHDAWSCDLLPTDRPGNHYQADVRDVLYRKPWDLMIAFPPCTHLAVSGARYFAAKRASGVQQQGVDFFLMLANAIIPRVAVENPIGIMSTLFRKPDQIIQPWHFGHPESKATCLWLRQLPLLVATNVLPKRSRWENQTPSGQNKLGPSPDRAKRRSVTYQGVADAMADQWGGK